MKWFVVDYVILIRREWLLYSGYMVVECFVVEVERYDWKVWFLLFYVV